LIKSYLKKQTVPIAQLLEAISLSNNGWHYGQTQQARERKVSREMEKEAVAKEIKQVQEDMPYYGYRRVTEALKRKNKKYNSKRILKVMGEYLLVQPRKRKNNTPKTTNSRHNYVIYTNEIKSLGTVYPSDVWVSDITYVYIGKRWAYLAVVMDQATRRVVGYSFSRTMTKQIVIDAIEMALENHKAPKYHHSDRGSQYCAYEYIQILKDNGVIPSMAAVGKSVDNPHAESFNRSLKVEEVYLNAYEDFEEAKMSIENYIMVYNSRRLHSSLGYRSPIEFEASYYKSLEIS